MIIDKISNYKIYEDINLAFNKVFKYILSKDLENIPEGRIEFENEEFYINVDYAQLKDENDAFLEAHDVYIDIQIPLLLEEYIGYSPREKCFSIKSENKTNDITFFKDKPEQLLKLPLDSFMIFFPSDAHAPLIGTGRTKKIIAKIKK